MTAAPLWTRPRFTPLERSAEVVLFVLAGVNAPEVNLNNAGLLLEALTFEP